MTSPSSRISIGRPSGVRSCFRGSIPSASRIAYTTSAGRTGRVVRLLGATHPKNFERQGDIGGLCKSSASESDAPAGRAGSGLRAVEGPLSPPLDAHLSPILARYRCLDEFDRLFV